MSITEKTASRMRAVMQSERLGRGEIEQLMRLGGLVGEMPAPDGKDEAGCDFWLSANFARWANRGAVHVRATLPSADLGQKSDGTLYRGGR